MNSLSMPAAWQGLLPQASPPPDMAIYQLPTGTYDTRAAFAYTGGSFSDKRHFAATAVLVTHPQGDFLIDAGFGADIPAHVHAQPWYARSVYQAASTAGDQLDASGYDRGRLRGVLITHSHWDHVSGLDRLQVPIWTNAGELQYAADSRDGTVFRTVSPGHEIHRYEFGNGPYLGFASSYDVHGDGSVVLALAGGHTTGSVIVFVTLPAGKRYAFIGDVAWQCEGITKPAERPLLMRKLADVDPGQVRKDLLKVVSLAGLIQIVPAHDLLAYEGIPRLASRATSSVLGPTEEWPAGFNPRTAPVYARNEIRTTLTAEQLWPALVTATRWPQWYPYAQRVKIAGGGEALTASSTFTWTTLRVRVKTQVTEFDTARRLAWSGSRPGAAGYHRWLLTPTAVGGCLVVTEEVQTGLLPRLAAGRLRRSLSANHQRWLEGLVEVSRAPDQPTTA